VLCFKKHSVSCVLKESNMKAFQVDGRTFSGYLAEPTPGSGPGVLVLHAWWGLTEPFRQVCDRLAEAGFVVLAPDLYHGKTTASVEEAEALVETLDHDVERVRGDIAAALQVLRQRTATHQADGRGKLALVGFSLGGRSRSIRIQGPNIGSSRKIAPPYDAEAARVAWERTTRF
jgi:dienelactone hydrolase